MPPTRLRKTLAFRLLYQQSVNYKARLDALGVPCELVTIAGGDHHIDLWAAIDASTNRNLRTG
jgi:hypothetical protein